MSTTTPIYTPEQLVNVAKVYVKNNCDRAETENLLKSLKLPDELITASLDEIQRQENTAAAVAVAVEPQEIMSTAVTEQVTEQVIEAAPVVAEQEPEVIEATAVVQEIQNTPKSKHPYPPELAPLIESGVARYEDDVWLMNRCDGCGQFRDACCGRIRTVSVARKNGRTFTLTSLGKQAAGLEPIRTPKPPISQEQILKERIAEIQKEPCWNQFRGVGELVGDGTVKMYIENFLPEGVSMITGLPKEGKSYLALAAAKALTTGEPLFGRKGFEVPEIVPVMFLAAEGGDGALKLRCKKFGITEDKTRFLARTLTQGVMFGLDSPEIEAVVKAMRPVVILETLIRFNDGNEDDASENRKLATAVFHLISLGARAVVGIHHSRKDVKDNPTKEAAVRGSGDGLAMVDVVWLVLQDTKLYQNNRGPNEIDLVGWGRDFSPLPMRLALTKKAPKDLPSGTITFAPGIVSCIDTNGNFEWVDRQEHRQELSQRVEGLIAEEPTISREKLVEETGATEWEIKTTLKRLGYHRPKGGKQGAGPWGKSA